MLLISSSAPLIDQVVGKQKRKVSQTYRLMTYVIQCPVDDGVLLYHTLTRCLVWLCHEEANNLTNQQELIDNWFLVPQEHDDHKFCEQIYQMVRLFQPPAQTITGYTILPTTGCNARCFYCYQKGTTPVAMTPEIASKVSRFIMAHRGDEKVKISWFGGEPLVNVKVIDQICIDLKENDVPFSSKMTSNGYLFDAEMVQRAKELWQIKHIQITIDGTEQIYNRIKDYVYKGVNAYERILRNIEFLTTEDIHVSVRLNVDHHNISEMSELVSQLHHRFGANKNLSIYSHELFGERTPEDNASLYEKRMVLEQQISSFGYAVKWDIPKIIKLNRCMADNDQSVVIAPDGHLGKCEHYIDREFFGHIDSEEKDKDVLRKFKERPADIEACATCPYYPQCFRLKMCENDCDCTPEMQKENIYKVIEAMKNEYQRYLNNEPHNNKEHETEL